MSYSIKGVVSQINPLQNISDKFKKQEFVLEVSETSGNKTYTEYIKIEATQNKTDLLSQFSAGDEVVVDFNIRGNKYEKNGETLYFTSLQMWRIANSTESESVPSKKPQPAQVEDDFEDDLPF